MAHEPHLPKHNKTEEKGDNFMAKKNDLSKEKRITKEEERLRYIYRDVEEDNKSIIQGLINRAAYMLITLEDWENDIDNNGYIEMFTQSEKTAPYERERPVIRLYNTMNKNYQSIIKQLTDLVPKKVEKPESDGFDDFAAERE